MQVFNTFAELGKAFGVFPRKRAEKPFVCRRCGKVMTHVPQTNVYICENADKEGKICGNRVFTKRIA